MTEAKRKMKYDTEDPVWLKPTAVSLYDKRDSWPKISIVTPSFNQGRFIGTAIQSLLAQSYPNLEFLIIDGKSTDETISVIRQYEDKIDYWVSESDEGQSDAINKGFSRCSGDILGWLNTDDFLLPNALFHVASTFLDNKRIDVVVGEADKIRPTGEVRYVATVPELSKASFLHWRNPGRPQGTGNFLQPACFFTRMAWQECGPLSQDLHYCMDVDLWMRMIQKFSWKEIDEKLAIAVGHEDAKTVGEIEKTAVELGLLLSSYGGMDVVRPELMQMAEELQRYRKVRKLPLVQPLIPIIRRVCRI